MGGWDPISYLLFFSYGYLIFSNVNNIETIKKYSPLFFGAAIILSAMLVDSHFGFIFKIPGLIRHDIQNEGALLPLNQSFWLAVQAFRGLLSWCWIIGLLGLGHRFLNFSNKFLPYANEAVLPFYILHHTVIYIIGFYIIQHNLNVFTSFLIIASISFIVIVAIEDLLVRRLRILRFLFGMKLIK